MTLVKFASKKQIVLLSENDLLMEAIEENVRKDARYDLVISRGGASLRSARSGRGNLMNHGTPTALALLRYDVPLLPKIDLLIADSADILLPHHKIKTIINIGGENPLSEDEIKFPKPLKLNNLLKLIDKTVNSHDVFCAINNDLIYNEVSRTLSSSENVIKFTEKENEIFKFVLLSSDFNIAKEILMKNIWQYHEDTESLTLDTHLYKLKTKLPKGLLEVKNNICRLEITSII